MRTFQVHEDYERLRIRIPMHPFILPFLQIITRLIFKRHPIKDGIINVKKTISGYDGHSIPLEIFGPSGIEHDVPCLLFLHGGAFALPATGYHKKLMCDYALGCSCKVVFVDYRLVPKYPYPFGLEDCYSAYKWLLEHAEEHGIDSTRIGICGDSAGGALAAALTLKIRDQSVKAPLFQLLVYPVSDVEQTTDSMKKFVDTPIWNARLNKKMWDLYLPKGKPSINVEYASPLQAASFNDLPKSYIEINEFDCLRDEALLYNIKLEEYGNEVTLVQTKGTVHGFELNYNSQYTQRINEPPRRKQRGISHGLKSSSIWLEYSCVYSSCLP